MSEQLTYEAFGNSHTKEQIFEKSTDVVFTFGNFDGVHLGHQYLLQQSKKVAPNSPLVVLTFEPHPGTFFHPQNPKKLLCTLEERIGFLHSAGASLVIVAKFNENFAALSEQEFCEKWLQEIFNVKAILYGHDLCYGKNRLGTAQHMKHYCQTHNIEFFEVNPYLTEEQNISSSLIRQSLANGNMEQVQKFLGRPYSLSGTVMHGAKRGRQLGFPTANLDCPTKERALPKYGVYACLVEVKEKTYSGVVNCGLRPTVADPNIKTIHIESHIFDFSESIYDEIMTVKFIHYIRDEKKFDSLDELKNQISLDIQSAQELFFTTKKDLL